MLTQQGGRLEQALIEGGMNPLAANSAMGAVANCAQPLQHRGPVSLDYTPRDFRFVTPELRKFRFGNMDKVGRDMPRKKQEDKKKKPPTSREDHPPEQQEPRGTRGDFDPLDGDGRAFEGVEAGPYIAVDGPYTSPRISLKASGTYGDVATFAYDRLTGTRLEIRTEDNALLGIIQNGLQFRLIPKGGYADVVTDVQVTDRSFLVTKRRCFLLNPDSPYDEGTDHKLITYLSDASLGSDVLRFEQREAYVVAGEDRKADNDIEITLVDCEA
jgi:hypothetical protein